VACDAGDTVGDEAGNVLNVEVVDRAAVHEELGTCRELVVCRPELEVKGDPGQEHDAEMAIALEANAYDLHLAMKRRFTDRASVQVFLALSRQEEVHLEKMTKLMLDRA